MKSLRLPAMAVFFLVVAFFSGAIVSRKVTDDRTAAQAIDSGLGRLGSILADLLWLQLDEYHHIGMYEGSDWETNAEYLPHLWLITRLNPQFADAYLTGGNHLAVNLGMPEEGIKLLQRGMRNCPGDERLVWEYVALLFLTDHLGPRATQEAAWRYLEICRRRRGTIREPWNEPNSELILYTSFQEDSLRLHADLIAGRYLQRSEFIRDAGRANLWLSD